MLHYYTHPTMHKRTIVPAQVVRQNVDDVRWGGAGWWLVLGGSSGSSSTPAAMEEEGGKGDDDAQKETPASGMPRPPPAHFLIGDVANARQRCGYEYGARG